MELMAAAAAEAAAAACAMAELLEVACKGGVTTDEQRANTTHNCGRAQLIVEVIGKRIESRLHKEHFHFFPRNTADR